MMIEKAIEKIRPWGLINSLYQYPFLAHLLQNAYFTIASYPKTVQIHFTAACDLDCSYCYQEQQSALPISVWEEVIDQAAALSVSTIEILGGEPLQSPDLPRLLDRISSHSMRITLYTNGVHVDKHAAMLSRYKENMILSIKYGFHRGVVSTLPDSDEAISSAVSAGLPVVAFITIDAFNADRIGSIISRAIELGAFPLLERYIPVKDDSTNARFMITSKQWGRALGMLQKAYSRHQKIIDAKAYSRGRTCNCYVDNLSITPDGEALPCPFAPRSLSSGNIAEKSLREIWKNFLKRRKEWLSIPLDCRKCPSVSLCRGGCRTYAYLKGSQHGKDPLCSGTLPPTYGHAAFSVLHDDPHALLGKNDQSAAKEEKGHRPIP